MKTQWYRIAPAVPVAAVPVDHQSCKVHDRDDYQRARLFMIGTTRAVAIGCIALYGVAVFNYGAALASGIAVAKICR